MATLMIEAASLLKLRIGVAIAASARKSWRLCKPCRHYLLLAGVILSAAASAAPGATHVAPGKQAATAQMRQRVWLEASQKAIGGELGSYQLTDTSGTKVDLGELRGKPLVISLIYTGCNHVCPLITQRLRRAVEEARRVIGADRFTVITVGFDVRNDTPTRMAAFARDQGVDLPGWRFLSGDKRSVSALARDLGFGYAASAGGYVHAAQTTIVDAEGRVYRQVYGDDFPLQAVVEPLKEAVLGRVGSIASVNDLIDRVLFVCTVYDPNTGRYRISYAIAMGLLAGLTSLGATAFVLARAWLGSASA